MDGANMNDLVDRLKDPHRRLVRSDREEAAERIDALETRLRAMIQWHQNWDAPFHEEDEWIEDFRLAKEAVGIVPARSVQV
jgi:hypothetical protein